MRLPFLRPKTDDKAARPARERAPALPLAEAASEMQAARTQARRRLVGAVVLLLIGIVGFPVLFETQPRPLPIDTPIEAPRREDRDLPAVKPLPVTVLPADAGTEEAPSATASASASASASAEVAVAEASAPVAAPLPAPAPVQAAKVQPQQDPLPATPATPATPSAPSAVSATVASAPESAARFVVQAGAYGEAAKLRDARAKIERLGLKTYTQVIDGDKGSRTRVRVGPFNTRAEAEAVAARVKQSGLPAAILAL